MEQKLAPSPNSHPLLDRTKPMKNFQDFVLKLTHSHPNAALPPAAETLLRDRLDDFASKYRTPDHPPYSAMIQNALEGLNEKGGSTMKSISRYLEERYDNLPLAHSLLLKRHLEATCESGEVVVSRTKKYSLAGNPNLSTKAESKPRKRRKWRLESDRQKHHQLKLRSMRKRNKQRITKVELIKKYTKHEEKERPLTEHGEDQTKSLLSSVHSNSTILQNEENEENEEKHTKEVSTQQNNGPSAIAKSENLEHQDKEDSKQIMKHQKHEENEQRFTGNGEDQLKSLLSALTELETASVREVPVTFCSELVTPPIAPKDGEFDSLQSECNMETLTNQGYALDLIPMTMKQMRHEKQFIEEDVVEVSVSVSNSAELMRNKRLGWRRNKKLKKSLLQNEHVFEPSLTSKESEYALSTEHEPRGKQVIFQEKQVCRSLRGKPGVAEDANMEEHCPVPVCRSQDTLLKQRPTKAKGKELQDSPKSQEKRMLAKPKPDVKNLKAVDNFEQSVKLGECTSTHENIPEQNVRKVHRLPGRRSTRLQNQR